MNKIKNIDPKMIVYSDETGIDDNEVSLMGWAPVGKRCYALKNAERKKRFNIIAALNLNKIFAPFVFEGYSNAHIYETYIAQVLVPVLEPGMVLVIDNASFHKSKRITDLIESAKCSVLFLPPYTPEFNPIENHWSAIKTAIRRTFDKTKDFLKSIIEVLSEKCLA